MINDRIPLTMQRIGNLSGQNILKVSKEGYPQLNAKSNGSTEVK